MLIEASRLSALGAPVSRVIEIDFISTPDTGMRPITVQPSKFNNNFALDRLFELEYFSIKILPTPVPVPPAADGFLLTEDGYFLTTESQANLVRE